MSKLKTALFNAVVTYVLIEIGHVMYSFGSGVISGWRKGTTK